MNILYRRINYVSNVVCKSYTILYCLVFFFSFFFLLQFPRYIMSVFTDWYMEGKLCQQRSSQYADEKISSIFLFVFANLLEVLMDKFKSVDNCVYKNNMSSYFLTFISSLFFHCNFLSIYQGNIFVGVYRWILQGHIQSKKFTVIYQQKYSIIVFVCIY